MYKFNIEKNNFLTERDVIGYYHQDYIGYRKKDNPDFICDLKNTFKDKDENILRDSRQKVINILMRDIGEIVRINKLSNCVCICVPRSKKLISYHENQLFFKDAVSFVANRLYGVIDGTNYIIRTKNTYTTHLERATRSGIILNDGDKPYKGITINTCSIHKSKIQGKDIILIDDVYTKNVNIDEDCIQALFDNGAKNIIFYSIGYTRRDQ